MCKTDKVIVSEMQIWKNFDNSFGLTAQYDDKQM